MKWTFAAAAALCGLAAPALGQQDQDKGTLEQRAACENDAIQFCGPLIPDKLKILACLKEFQAQISPPCRALVMSGEKRRQ